jgi:uncharacterized membrane protein
MPYIVDLLQTAAAIFLGAFAFALGVLAAMSTGGFIFLAAYSFWEMVH